MRLIKMRHLLRFMVAAFAVYGALLIRDEIVASQGSFTIEKEERSAPSGPIYSFNLDDDKDLLSNATEIAIGSNPNSPNSDDDEYPDAEELKWGYDPSRLGEARLEDRETQSETIKFLVWASKREKKYDDPLTYVELISDYLNESFNPPAPPVVSPKEIYKTTKSDLETITVYLYKLHVVPLPSGIAAYSELARAVQETGNAEPLESIIKKIEAVEDSYQKMIVPEDAVAIHKEYLLLTAELKRLYEDLRYARSDPVLIAKNIIVGQFLLEKASVFEEVKAELGASFLSNSPPVSS